MNKQITSNQRKQVTWSNNTQSHSNAFSIIATIKNNFISTAKTYENRSSFLDIAKGLAMFLVIWGHSLQYYSCGAINFFENPVFRFIYSFHMPLFMLLSGYLFYFSFKKHSLLQIVTSRLQHLVIPLLSWGVLFTILSHFYDGADITLKSLYNNMFNIWFIWVVLLATLITEIIELFAQKIPFGSILHIIFFLLIFFVKHNIWGLRHYYFQFVYPFFFIGFLYNKYKAVIPKILYNFRFVFIPLFFILFPYFHTSQYVYTSRINLYTTQIGFTQQLIIDLFRWSIGLVGSLFILVVLELVLKIAYIPIVLDLLFKRLGKISLQMYVTQRFFLETVCIRYFKNYIVSHGITFFTKNEILYSFYWSPIIAIIFCIILYWLIKLIGQIKPLNFILYGGR